MSPMSERCESSVSIRLLNVDHREIEGLIDQLQAAIAVGPDKDRVTRLLRQLSDFTRTHFALEEGMMAATEYPGTSTHRRRHQQLQQQLDGFVSLYSKGSLTLSMESLSFLFVWYAAHSQNEDAHYTDWLVFQDAGLGPMDPAALPYAARSNCA